jgi:hypothetical protein
MTHRVYPNAFGSLAMEAHSTLPGPVCPDDDGSGNAIGVSIGKRLRRAGIHE